MKQLEKGKGPEPLAATIRRIPSTYGEAAERFAVFVEAFGYGIGEGVMEYPAWLEIQRRIDREGREVSYSSSWHNRQVKAVKEIVRYLLDHSDMRASHRAAVEGQLNKLKYRRPKEGISKAERVPSPEEVQVLLERADPRLSLVIEFLYVTGCRISEALGAEIGAARRGERITHISILGKGALTRDLRVTTQLYDRIRAQFNGSRLLFEHSGRPYSRIATTNRIKQLAERTIGKPVTAHMIRHRRGTDLSDQLGISKAASVLGHRSINTTKAFYDHSEASDEEFLNSLNRQSCETKSL